MNSLRFRLATLAFILSSPAFAVDTGGDPSALMETARASIDAEDYGAAIATLGEVIVIEPQNADALNLMGFAQRKSGMLDAAQGYYQAALAIDPNHLGALEYQGELFIMLGDIAAAEANLAKLAAACGACEEHADLAEALAGS
jgi:tetratricopeptide (TPR) repeat protein